MSKKLYIDVFIKLIYPEMTELAMTTLSEQDCIEDATKLIKELKAEIERLQEYEWKYEELCK